MGRPKLKLVSKGQIRSKKNREATGGDRAALVIQRHFRGHLARREANTVHTTLVRIQARQRGWVVRRKMSQNSAAALLIQRVERGRAGRVRTLSRRLEPTAHFGTEEALRRAMAQMSLKDAAATVAEAYGLPRRKVYQAALALED